VDMNLFVLGATGKTGSRILDLARARGHQVTAFVRSPSKLPSAPGLRVVGGDPLDPSALSAAMPGHDAVLSAIGAPPGQALFRPHTVVSDIARATVQAMSAAGVSRLGLVSAAVLFPETGLRFAFFRWLLQHVARDLTAAEAVVRASDLDWTLVRPPRLVRSDETRARVAPDALPPGGTVTSFAAVAAFLLDAVERHEHSRTLVGLAR